MFSRDIVCCSCQYYLYKHPWVPAYQGVITFFVLANFTLATFMDPGVIPKGKVYLLYVAGIVEIACNFVDIACFVTLYVQNK